MARDAIPTWFFVLVVVRKADRFLLVHECKRDQDWYLPAGRVEPGESFVAAAVRETLEEAGIPIEVLGLIRIEHTPQLNSARMRVIYLGQPLDDTPPKQEADEESLGATWVSVSDLAGYSLRGEEVGELCRYVLEDGPVYPVSILQPEGMPYEAT